MQQPLAKKIRDEYAMKIYLQSLQRWLDSLQPRERQTVVGGGISLAVILFYLLLWDPVMSARDELRQGVDTQRQELIWMKTSAQEIRQLQSGGGAIPANIANQSPSTLVTMSAQSNGMQEFIGKMDSTSNGVEVTLNNADFNRVMSWLSDLQNRYALQPKKIVIEPQADPGTVNARISIEKNS